MMNDEKKEKIQEIIKMINAISGRHSVYDVFCDWVHCLAMSIQNSSTLKHDETWQMREKEYLDIMSKYDEKEQNSFYEMTARLIEAMEAGYADILGEIYMGCKMGSSHTGQFFTPFHLSLLTAQLSLSQVVNKEKIKVHEPTCGSGGMVIAAAQVLKDEGINVRSMDVIAQDMAWICVYMCYVQLSLYGISAVVVQGDTLMQPYDPKLTEPYRVLKTPAKMGALV